MDYTGGSRHLDNRLDTFGSRRRTADRGAYRVSSNRGHLAQGNAALDGGEKSATMMGGVVEAGLTRATS